MSHHFKCTAKLLSARLQFATFSIAFPKYKFLCCCNFQKCETISKKSPYQEHQFGHESDTCVGFTEDVEQETVLEEQNEKNFCW